VKASSESEVAGCLMWRSLSSPDLDSGYAGCRAGTILYGSGFVAADQTSFFAARVKQWHQSGRSMDDVRGCACWKHGPGTSSEPPARELEREPRRLARERGVIPSLLSLIRAGNSNAHSEERSTYVAHCVMRTDGLQAGMLIAL
jgi:hypothetical protein